MGHIHFPFTIPKICLKRIQNIKRPRQKQPKNFFRYICQCCRMVQMKATLSVVSSKSPSQHLLFSLSNKNRINCTPIQFVNEGKGSHTTVRGMNSCIAYDSSSPVLENTARTSDFLTSTKHSHTQSRSICHVEKTGGSKSGLPLPKREETDVTHIIVTYVTVTVPMSQTLDVTYLKRTRTMEFTKSRNFFL